MILQAVLMLALLAAAGYGLWEVRRWYTPAGRDLVSPRQRVLRGLGFVFLLACLGLWLGGTYLPLPHKGDTHAAIAFIQYWTLTVLTAVPLIPLAILDSRENLRRFSEERKKLLQETLGPFMQEKQDASR